MRKKHDVIVIGEGLAAYAAARTTRAAGVDVAALLRRTKEVGFPAAGLRAELSHQAEIVTSQAERLVEKVGST
jgi:thioredoxin reductase